MSFRNAYSGNPVCAPGRACMMTGQFASDVGAYCNSTPFDGHVPSWGNRLRDAGYHCWATGKMDLWRGKDFGFHEVATNHGHCEGPDITSLFRSPVCFRPDERKNVNGWFEERDSPDKPKKRTRDEVPARTSRKNSASRGACTSATPSRIRNGSPTPSTRRSIRRPQMPLPRMPEGYLEKRHDAFQVLANFKNVQVPFPADRIRRARSAYYGMVTEVDELVGNVLDELDRTGQRDNTLIIYTSDHGEMLGEHGLWLKNTLLENAARVPLIFSGPGMPKGKSIETPVSHVDMVATMMEIGGAATSGLRGHSLVPMARGESSAIPDSLTANRIRKATAPGRS